MLKKRYLIGGTIAAIILLVIVFILACYFTPTKVEGSSVSIDDTHYCVAEGTMVTLADGSYVRIEALKGNEELMVWDMMSGKYSSSPILFVSKNPTKLYEIIELIFSDGTDIKVIDEHAFFDVDTQEYVFLDNNAEEYIGHTFKKGNKDVTLLAVKIYDEYETSYSLVTKGNMGYYVNGILSMPGNAEGMINIFKVNDMKVDEEMMNQDIKVYGLYTYEEFCSDVFSVPKGVFEAFNGQYLKISMKKGLIDVEGLKALYNKYCGYFNAEPISDVKLNVFDRIVYSIKSFLESVVELFK